MGCMQIFENITVPIDLQGKTSLSPGLCRIKAARNSNACRFVSRQGQIYRCEVKPNRQRDV